MAASTFQHRLRAHGGAMRIRIGTPCVEMPSTHGSQPNRGRRMLTLARELQSSECIGSYR
jgi:hypothetical protein